MNQKTFVMLSALILGCGSKPMPVAPTPSVPKTVTVDRPTWTMQLPLDYQQHMPELQNNTPINVKLELLAVSNQKYTLRRLPIVIALANAQNDETSDEQFGELFLMTQPRKYIHVQSRAFNVVGGGSTPGTRATYKNSADDEGVSTVQDAVGYKGHAYIILCRGFTDVDELETTCAKTLDTFLLK